MAKLAEEIQRLQRWIEKAREERATAEAQHKVAQQALAEALGQLGTEFGVHDLNQAQLLLEKAEAEAATELRKVEQHLAAAEEQQ